MALTDIAFSDDVINSSQLKRHWKHWISQVYQHPITIVTKDEPLILIKRKDISELTRKMYYTYLVVSFCQRYIKERSGKGSALAWTEYLGTADMREFFKELLKAYEESYNKDDWSIIQDTLEDWKATAEVESNPELSKLLKAKLEPSSYVEVG